MISSSHAQNDIHTSSIRGDNSRFSIKLRPIQYLWYALLYQTLKKHNYNIGQSSNQQESLIICHPKGKLDKGKRQAHILELLMRFLLDKVYVSLRLGSA